MIRAENEITLVRVDDGLDGKMSAEQIAQLNQASADASQAKTDASTAKTTAETANSTAQAAQSAASQAQTKADQAQADAATAQTTADNAQTTAKGANDKILSWCHENNQTLIDGAKIYTGSIDAESIDVKSLTTDVAFIDEMETTLTRFKAVGENGYYETEITGEGIDFKYGTSEETAKTIAGISGDELQIKKTSVLDEMKIGKWSWKVNPNNSHLTLRWNGGDE